jgi:hypothetical protein
MTEKSFLKMNFISSPFELSKNLTNRSRFNTTRLFAMHVVNPFIFKNFDKIHLYFRFVLLLQKGTQTEENVEENI